MSDRFFDSAGVRIRFVDLGPSGPDEPAAGPPVLFLHGFTLDLETQWLESGLLRSMARDHRVVALDLRGHGQSGRPHDPAAYGLPMALDAVHLLDHLEIERADLVGYSMGGEIALKLLALRPARWRRAVLGGAGWMRDGDFKHQTWAGGVPVLEQIEPGASIVDAFAPPPEMAPSDALRAVVDANDPRALAGVSRGMASMTVSDAELRGIETQTTVIFGERDWIRPTFDGMGAAMPDVTLRVVPGLSHEELIFDPRLEDEIRAALDPEPPGG